MNGVKDFGISDCAPAGQPRGNPMRPGAHLTDGGCDFSVFAGHARSVEVCLFEEDGKTLHERRFRLHRSLHGYWRGFVDGICAGQLYGYRVYGVWDPKLAMFHNPAKVLLDPYARLIGRVPVHCDAIYSAQRGDGDADRPACVPLAQMKQDHTDSAPFAALGMVAQPDTPGSAPLYTPWNKTVFYETHVVGQTREFTAIPPQLRGTYAGLAHPETIRHLRDLGITALELLPIQAKWSEPFLVQKGLENYWGYNTLSYFAPEPSYATEASRRAGPQAVLKEVKDMVAGLHEAGIEVIMDVVYNHSCEGGIFGPSLCWRGLDSSEYYLYDPARPGQLKNTTGCGNSFDFRRLPVLRMTLDSLRYWVENVGVDGFRFDLAATLGREGDRFNPHHALFGAFATDPVLSRVKLIAEPWDVGPNGWQTGNFPVPMADWNDRFRDAMRAFWLSEPAQIAAGGSGSDLRDFATRLAGSADLFGHGRIPEGRGIHSSVNFVTVHDGFSLCDLTAYNGKHNGANLEDNRDGSDFNNSWNHGTEGEASEEIQAKRRKSVRNLLATLLISAGTPLLRGGDEILKTQHGNNNAYCQNSPISWLNWENEDGHSRSMCETASYLLKLRRENSVFRPNSFYRGESRDGGPADLGWFDADGQPMAEYKWFNSSVRTLQMLRAGGDESPDALVVFNGHLHDTPIKLPAGDHPYRLVWCSDWERPRQNLPSYRAGASTSVSALSMRIYLTHDPEKP